jgi:outer membrane protein TolC
MKTERTMLKHTTKPFFCAIFYLIFSPIALAQSTDYNKIVIPSEVDSVPLLERLVQLAWQNNPAARQADLAQEVSELELRRAKRAWLDNLQIVGNLNEANINPSERTANLFFPRYNFGVQLNLGRLASTPVNAKIAAKQLDSSSEAIKAEKLRIRAEVSRLYAIYQAAQELLLIQNEVTEDAYADFLLAENRFKTGEMNIEQYNIFVKTYNAERVKRIQAQQAFTLAKIGIEEIIGLALEEVAWP